MHRFSLKYLPLKPIATGFIDVDCDPAAERLMVINRKTGALISHKKIIAGRFSSFIAKEYLFLNDLMCVMFDDNGNFNAAVTDNVEPLNINLVTFDPTNPQPYEP
ncbi:hypothetical protein P20652_3702 [Pseudoalteromonas sp. BSi20652]|uniref:hypothetical protein n=1 Tax=Pseudoalteromonas sp. BSi20652 TaxID=388384 RepID=UPI0002318C1B|nr:hypothetical protein [Pseudoalteromonas sp. BSi20652]GAA61813.1 hypothetical protein P20652_3702 [Pseudoalteromonas sp. BSi20652]